MHKIKLKKSEQENTFWLDTKPKQQYLQEIDTILENGSSHDIAKYIISQFNETDEELKPLFREALLSWIKTIKKEDYSEEKMEKIKDSIYEMF